MLKEKAMKTILAHNLIENNDNIVIGVSGGPDSMALLYFLMDIKDKISFNIYVAHLNHGVRGEEAVLDEKYVEEICFELGLPFYSKKVDMNEYAKIHKMSSEESGRKLRYDFFRELVDKVGGGKIAVAHNKNDQAETILMRIMRGTGIDGLRGMDYRRGDIIRPLLDVSREEIEEYLKDKNVEARVDKTNLENIYSRNKIRLELIPYMEENFNPNIIDTLWRNGNIIGYDSDFLQGYSQKVYSQLMKKETKSSIILNRSVFKEQHIAIRSRIIRNALLKINGSLQGFTQNHINDVMDLFIGDKTGKEIHLVNDTIAKTSYDDLIIEKAENKKVEKFNCPIRINDVTYIKKNDCFFETKVLPIEKVKINCGKRFIKCFDYDKIVNGLKVRNRISGDRFTPLGMDGSKKLKDFFIDEKIPKEERDAIPLIVDGKEIIWVVGYRMNEKYKVTSNTKNVILIKYYKNYEELRRIRMKDFIKEILVSSDEIEKRVGELGKQITEDYKGKDLLLVGILKGAVIFMADLAKNIDLPITMDFMAVSSYGKSSESSGVVKIIKDLDSSVEGKDILIVEDIIDTGFTLGYLTDYLKRRGASSVKICTLLDKPDRRKIQVPVDYKGFVIPDEFVVGYGLDYAEQYRNLPYISALKEEVYS